MMKREDLIKFGVFIAFAECLALATAQAKPASKNQHIRDFRYTSCGEKTCVQLKAPEAHVSLFGGAFSTEGQTEFAIFNRDGSLISRQTGKEASFNPAIQLITLSNGESGFFLYSLKDEQLSSFMNGGQAVKK